MLGEASFLLSLVKQGGCGKLANNNAEERVVKQERNEPRRLKLSATIPSSCT